MKKRRLLDHFVISIFVFMMLNTLSVFAGPSRTTYQAKIIKPDGYPLESTNVNFKFTILDPLGSCILYSETFSNVNMGSSAGLVSFALGTGVRTFPVVGSNFEQVFSNTVASLICDSGGPATYSPSANDTRKIVMQFNDSTGWQTLPAMTINAVPYAMYANDSLKFSGKDITDFVQTASLPTCGASEAIRFNGAGFSCIAAGGTGTITSGSVTTALGYTPADGASVTAMASTVNSVSSTVFSVSSTVTSLQSSVAASFAAITSSQWSTSGTSVYYNSGNVGIGMTMPITKLDVSGGVRIGMESATCAATFAGTLRYNGGNVEYCNGSTWTAFGVSGAGLQSFNGSTSGTQTLAIGTAGNAPAFNTSNGVHTLNIPLASAGAVTAGLLSNVDYVNFSNKITSSAASIAQVLGYVPASATALGNYLVKANNLSDVASASVARTNLGVGYIGTLSSVDLGSSDVSSTLAIARTPAYTGDVTKAAASDTLTLSNTGVTTGTYTKVTVDSKGRVTSSSALASGDVTTALGYTPAASGSFTSSQWTTSGSAIYYNSGNVGIGTTSPTAKLHIAAGTSSTAALKFTSGTLLASPQSGTMEYDGFNYYVTDGNNVRRTIATGSSQGSIDNASNVNSTGNIVMTPNNGANSVIVSSTVASTSSNTGALAVNGGAGIAGALNVGGIISGSAIIKGTGYRANQGAPDAADSSTVGYAFGQDGDTGIFSPGSGAANGVLAFYSNNVERMRMTVSGALGIGTTSPSALLEVQKDFGSNSTVNTVMRVNARGTASGAGFGGSIDFLSSNEVSQNDFLAARIASVWEVADNGFGLGVFTKNVGASGGDTVERVRITNTGNVGIGTASPNSLLEVRFDNSTVGHNSFSFQQRGFVGITGAKNVAMAVPYPYGSGVNLNETSGYLDLIKTASGNTILATNSIDGSPLGNVGVGTTTPVAKLDVAGGGLSVSGWSNNNSGIAGGLELGWDGSQSVLQSYNRVGSAFTPMTYSASVHTFTQGNVGIGTASPTTKLHVVDGTNNYIFSSTAQVPLASLKTDLTGPYAYTIGKAQTANNAANFRYNHVSDGSTSNYVGLGFWSNDDLFVVKATGQVGIGTTTPSQTLEVSGTVKATSFSGPGILLQAINLSAADFISNTTSVWSDVPNLSSTFTTAVSATVDIVASGMYRTMNSSVGNVRLVIDGTEVAGDYIQQAPSAGTLHANTSINWAQTLAAGTHTIKVQWRNENATGSFDQGWNDSGRVLSRRLKIMVYSQ